VISLVRASHLKYTIMAEFVRAQIFGTTFEITSRYGCDDDRLEPWTDCQSGTRICSPWAWVHSGWFGEHALHPRAIDPRLTCRNLKLCKRPIDTAARRRQEDHEAFLHSRPGETNLPRTEAAETPPPRECEKKMDMVRKDDTDGRRSFLSATSSSPRLKTCECGREQEISRV
jgi:hypothetical protein